MGPRRVERDLRAPRFESEVRSSEVKSPETWKNGRLGFCNRCKRAYEDCSKWCPECSRRNLSNEMGTVRPIPEGLREEAKRKALERARRSLGL